MPSPKRLQLLLLLTVLVAGGWFYSFGSWNSSARYDAVFTIVENGTFQIDRFLPDPEYGFNTGDWSQHDGHYYSSKAPGSSLLGALAYAPAYWVGQGLFRAGHTPAIDLFYVWWINFWVSVVPLALGALCLFRLLIAWRRPPRQAFFWALLYALATPLWPYSTQLWGHPLAAACLAAALYALWKPEPAPLLAGLAFGGAVLADYGAALAIPCLALPLIVRRDWKGLLRIVLGGLLPALVFCWYHWVCFGNPFTIANAYANPVFLQSEGAGGMMSSFSLVKLWKLLFGMYRSFLWASPILILAVPGFLALWRQHRRAHAIGLALCYFAGLLPNAAYGFWHAGASMGTRFVLYSIPALVLLAAHFDLSTAPRQWLACLLAAVSLANMYTVSSISVITPEARPNPIYQDAWWMTWRDHAKNRNRSMGLRLYDTVLENRVTRNPVRHAVSPGRLLFGHRSTPWSDTILLAALAAILLWLGRRDLRLPPSWKPAAHDWLRAAPPRLRSPWAWIFLAALLAWLCLPGLGPWGNEQNLHLFQPALDGVFGPDARDANHLAISHTPYVATPLLWIYQAFLTLHPSPIVLAWCQALLNAAIVLWAMHLLARHCLLPRAPLFCLALVLPGWWMLLHTIGPHAFAPALVLLSLSFFASYTPADKRTHLPALYGGCLSAIAAIALSRAALPYLWAALLLSALCIWQKPARRDPRNYPVLLLGLGGFAVLLIRLKRFHDGPDRGTWPDALQNLAALFAPNGLPHRLRLLALLIGLLFAVAGALLLLRNRKRFREEPLARAAACAFVALLDLLIAVRQDPAAAQCIGWPALLLLAIVGAQFLKPICRPLLPIAAAITLVVFLAIRHRDALTLARQWRCAKAAAALRYHAEKPRPKVRPHPTLAKEDLDWDAFHDLEHLAYKTIPYRLTCIPAEGNFRRIYIRRTGRNRYLTIETQPARP